jgi:predicted metalloprotease with PDZ domain
LPVAEDRAAASSGAAYHHVSFPRRDTQYVHVELTLAATGEQLELAMPTWTPGSYLIRDFAGQVERVRAHSSQGASLAVTKVAKNRWQIDTGGARQVRVEYDVWAGVLGVQESWVEHDFALLNGAGLFMFSEESRRLPQYLEVTLPDDWPNIDLALPGPDESGRYRAENFDALVDSPVLVGATSRHRFEAGGARFALVDYGETRLWDGESAADDLAKIAQAQIDFWGTNPFDREYLFLNILLGGSGGLEHDNSTVMMASPSAMRSREEYLKWMALASHELFHAWNVRRMRPQALSSYDYEREIYTPQLWLAEGVTSYYDNLMLFRAAVVTVQEFFDLLAVEMQQYELQPGRLVTSAEQASFDSWIRQYKPNPNVVNSNSNYYRKGSLIGFVIDTEIRKATNNRSSLDDAMREMYERYGPQGPGAGSYPPGALSEIVTRLGGPEVGALLQTLLADTTDPDVDEALAWYGLTLLRTPDQQAAAEAGKPALVDFGLTWQSDSKLLLVENVIHGGAAADAGVLPNDELLAVDGLRVTRENLDAVMDTLRPDEKVALTLTRHGRLMTREIDVQLAIPGKYLISVLPAIRSGEERRLEEWLGRPLQIKR